MQGCYQWLGVLLTALYCCHPPKTIRHCVGIPRPERYRKDRLFRKFEFPRSIGLQLIEIKAPKSKLTTKDVYKKCINFISRHVCCYFKVTRFKISHSVAWLRAIVVHLQILCEVPAGNNWNFDVQWSPCTPGVLSTSSYDGRIGIYNIEVSLEWFFVLIYLVATLFPQASIQFLILT